MKATTSTTDISILDQSIKNSSSSWTPALHGCGFQVKLVLILLNAQATFFKVESPILLGKQVAEKTGSTVLSKRRQTEIYCAI